MQLFYSLATGALAFAALATAAPQQDTPTTQAEVTIYSEANFQGEELSFTPDGSCQSLSPQIRSIEIPWGFEIFCQLFDNAECSGDGGDVFLLPVSEVRPGESYPGVICNFLL